jgi:hypothetical protein
MADNTTQTGTATIAADDVTTLNGAASSGVLVQRVKQGFGDDGDHRDVSHAYPLPVQFASDVATVTTVTASITSVPVVAANANRRGLIIHATTASAIVYIRLGGGTASSAAGGHSFDMSAGGYYEAPFGFTGAITAIWGAATGALNVTELT